MKNKALAQHATQKKYHTEPRDLRRHPRLLEVDGNFATDLVETGLHPHYLKSECLAAEAHDGNHPRKTPAC